MTTVWKPTRHAWWIWLLPVLTFILVGSALIWLAMRIPPGTGSDLPGLTRRSELLFMGIFFIVVPAAFSLVLFTTLRRRQRKAEWIEENGIPATAEIISFEHSGATINNLPQYRFRLKIVSDDGSSSEVEMKSCISLLQLQNIKRGNRFLARIDPGGKGGMVVDFSKTAEAD